MKTKLSIKNMCSDTMKTNNSYLKTIAEKLGVETMSNRTNNHYLRKTFEKLGGSADSHKTDNYYLKFISENIDTGGGSCEVEVDWSISDVLFSRITSVKVPNSITSLPDGFASSLANLKSIELPPTLQIIGNACFGSCVELIEIDIPSSVSAIGYNTFPTNPSAKLEKVYLNWTENPVEYAKNKIGLPNNGKAVFIIPKGTTALYESANYPSDKLVEREE